MEEAINNVVETRKVDIDDWLTSNPNPGSLMSFSASSKIDNLGKGFQSVKQADGSFKIEPITRPLNEVNLVLKSDGAGGYLIHTAHPQQVNIMNWENGLGNIFGAYINQQTLEDGVEEMTDISADDISCHNDFLSYIENGINSCKENEQTSISLINKSGYQVRNLESALEILEDLMEAYKESYSNKCN